MFYTITQCKDICVTTLPLEKLKALLWYESHTQIHFNAEQRERQAIRSVHPGTEFHRCLLSHSWMMWTVMTLQWRAKISWSLKDTEVQKCRAWTCNAENANTTSIRWENFYHKACVMVQFNASTWLGYGAQLFVQILVLILLWKYFVDVINIYNWLNLRDYNVGGPHEISWRSYKQNLRLSNDRTAKFCLYYQLATPPYRVQTQDNNINSCLSEFLDCWSALQISASRLQHQVWVSSFQFASLPNIRLSSLCNCVNQLLITLYIQHIYFILLNIHTETHIHTLIHKDPLIHFPQIFILFLDSY